MKNYELMYIIDTAVADEKREQIIEKFKSLIESNNGKVVSEEKIGVKKFAYPINYKTEGYYVLMAFESDVNLITELKRVAGITDGILRRLITKA